MVFVKKPILHLKFHFGYHHNASDFEKAKQALDKFKPHIYAEENASANKAELFKCTRPFNEGLMEAKNNSRHRAELISRMAKVDDQGENGFLVAQLKYEIDSPHIIGCYPLEAMGTVPIDPDHLKTYIGRLNWKMAEDVMRGGLCDASILSEMDFDRFLAGYYGVRDNAVIENIRTYRDDLLSLFPQLSKLDEVRVSAKFGAMHSEIYHKALAAYGKDGTIRFSAEFDELPLVFGFSERIQRALMFEHEIDPIWIIKSMAEKITYVNGFPAFDISPLDADSIMDTFNKFISSSGITQFEQWRRIISDDLYKKLQIGRNA